MNALNIFTAATEQDQDDLACEIIENYAGESWQSVGLLPYVPSGIIKRAGDWLIGGECLVLNNHAGVVISRFFAVAGK